MSSEPPDQNETQPDETTPNSFQQSINASGGAKIDHVSQTINVINRSETEELNDFLDKAMADFENRMAGLFTDLLLDAAQPKEPFKSLEYFKPEDSSIFFGRSAASRELYAKVVDNRLLILYARSGAGKSSILNAGLIPLLLRENRLPVYVRIQSFEDDLELEIKQAIFPLSRTPWPRVVYRLSLHEFLSYVSMKRQRAKEIVIILDQFEQFLISLPNKAIHQKFIQILRDCYEDQYLPVRFIISLKHEHLGDLDPFEQYIPGILQNRYSLLPMSEEEFKEAITKPVQKVNPAISFEPTLLDTLIRELGGKNVELTHLQIVCSLLYSKLPEGQQVITTRLYEEQGRVNEILSTYLDKTLEPLPEYKHKVARNILLELVGSEGTNRVLRLLDFEKVVDPDSSVIENVLEYLVDKHLLRRDVDPEEKRYELAHDYLADEISKLLGKEQLESKKAQDMLRREVVNNRIVHTVIEPEQLNYLKTHLRFRSLDKAARELLFESSLNYGHDVDFWLEQMEDKPAAAAQAATFMLENKPLRKKIALCLKGTLAKEFHRAFLSPIWNRFNQPKYRQRVDSAKLLWLFRGWLSPRETVRVLPVLFPFWVGRASLFGLVPVLIVGLALVQIRSIATSEQHVALNWKPIPEGSFVMGMDEAEADKAYQECLEILEEWDCDTHFNTQSLLDNSGRQEGAWLPAYSILENEVTTVQYGLCVEAEACTEPGDWEKQQLGVNDPVRSISWDQASNFCAWLGGRLPTEAEWEKAARGPENTLFPWGADWAEGKANLETGSVQNVLAFADQDKSGYEILNLAGNLQEWTASRWLDHKLGQPFTNEVLTQSAIDADIQNGIDVFVVVRGGSWETIPSEGMSPRRIRSRFGRTWETVGFRCMCPAGQQCSQPGGSWWDLLRVP